jgi:hypothetical protein
MNVAKEEKIQWVIKRYINDKMVNEEIYESRYQKSRAKGVVTLRSL